MHKPISVSLVVALTLSGCSAFQTSPTWKKVVETRAGHAPTTEPDPAYADRLHRVLASDQVEHKVVTYQFRYQTALREEAVGTGTAVVYRDATTPSYPWWLMDETLTAPVWLPNGEVARQLSFFLHHQASVISEQDFGGGELPDKAVAVPRVAKANSPVPRRAPVTLAARVKPQPAPAAAPKVVMRIKPQRTPAPVASRGRGTVARQATPSAPQHLAPARSGRLDTSPRLAITSPKQKPLDERIDARFRARHGTNFDPSSRVDRRKMDALRRTVAPRNQIAGLRTF
ncbi:MAG: hypothetical protein QOE70_3041 [Chthoniobacter sp.]|jgi:hypothetical protein|nr:hypothetical protein [Chthoniobacter sp.]